MYEEIHYYIKKQTPRIRGCSERKHDKNSDERKKIKLKFSNDRRRSKLLNCSKNLNKNNLNFQSLNKCSNNKCNQCCLQWLNPIKSCIRPTHTCNIKQIGNYSLQTCCCQPTCLSEFYSKRPASYDLQVKVLDKPQPYVAFPQSCTPCTSSTPCSTICPTSCPPLCLLQSPLPCPSPCPCLQPCPQVRVQSCQISSPPTRPSYPLCPSCPPRPSYPQCAPCIPCPSCPPCPPCSPCRQPRFELSPAYLSSLYTQQSTPRPPPCASLCVPQIPLSLPRTTLCPKCQVQPYSSSSKSRHRTSRLPEYVSENYYKSSRKCPPCRCEKQSRHLLNAASVPLNKVHHRTQKMKKNQEIQTIAPHTIPFVRPRQPPHKKIVHKKIQELQDKLKKGQPAKQIKFKKEVKDRATGMPLKQRLNENSACKCAYQCFLVNSTKDGNEYQCVRTDVLPQNKALLDSLKKRQLKFKDNKIPKNIPLIIDELKMSNLPGNRQDIPYEPFYQDQTLDYPIELRGRNHPLSSYYRGSFKPKKHAHSFSSNLQRKPRKLMPYRSHSLPHVISEPHGYSEMELYNYPHGTYREYPEEVIENVYLDGDDSEIFEPFEVHRPSLHFHILPPRPSTAMDRRKRFWPNRGLLPMSHRSPMSHLRPNPFYSNQPPQMLPRPFIGNRTFAQHRQPFKPPNPIHPLYGTNQNYEDEQVVILDADIEDGGIYEFDYDMLQANNNYGASSESEDYVDYIDDYYYDDGCGDHIEEEEYVFDSYPEQYQYCQPCLNYYYDYCDEIPYEVEEIILEDTRPTYPFNYYPCTPMSCCCNNYPMPVTNISAVENGPELSEKSNNSTVNSAKINEEVNKILKTNPVYNRLLEEKRENKIKAEVDKVLSAKTKIENAVNAALIKHDMLNSCNPTCDCDTPVYPHSCCPCTNFQPHCAHMNVCPPCPMFNPITISPICPAAFSCPCPCPGQQVLMFPSRSHDASSNSSSSSQSSECSAGRCCSRSKSCVPCRCHSPSIIPIAPSPSCFPIPGPNWHCHNCPNWPPLNPCSPPCPPCSPLTCCRPSPCNPLTRYYAKKAKKYRKMCKRRPFKIIKNKDSNEILKKELERSDHKMNVIKELNKDICNLLAEKEKKEQEIRSMEIGGADTDINAIKLEIARLKADYKLHHGKKKKKCLKDGEICVLGDASSSD